jgi:hypothetical protein
MSSDAGDSRKQAVSIRMNRGDVRTIKRLAERLGARESDVIRFAVKLMLSQLALLQDPSVRGRSLVPLFIDAGPELMRHFELDSAKLSAIINDGTEPEQRVDPSDIQLIAMNALQRSYTKLRVAGLRRAQDSGGRVVRMHASRIAKDAPPLDEDGLESSLRQYLYEKYFYSGEADQPILASNMSGGT